MINYDSTVDAVAHKAIVEKTMNVLLDDLTSRAKQHDDSKLTSPEKECYDKYIPLLKKTKYGTPEYMEVRKAMDSEGLFHHYEVNRHHPEHFEKGIHDFTIVDLVEYFVDTYSASTKSDTPYEDGVKTNAKRHDLPDLLVEIFINTVNEYFPK